MKKSYIKNLEESFPKIVMPLNEEQLIQLEGIANLQVQQKFASKSELIDALQSEMEIANSLYKKACAIAEAWEQIMQEYKKYRCGGHLPLPYKAYEKDGTKETVTRLYDSGREGLQNFLDRTNGAVNAMHQTLYQIKEKLRIAYEVEEKGLAGENSVEAYLTKHLPCRILSNVILPSSMVGEDAPKTAESDLLVLTDHGVFACEVKNYGKAGQTLDIQPDGQILKRDYAGRLLENMGSPFAQNQRHEDAVRRILFEAGLGDVPVYPVVIIANTDVEIVNNSCYWVKDVYDFRDAVRVGINGPVISQERLRMAYDVFQSKRMPERKFPYIAVSGLANRIEMVYAMLRAFDANFIIGWYRRSGAEISQWAAQVDNDWLAQNRPRTKFFVAFKYQFTCSVLCSVKHWIIALFIALIGSIIVKDFWIFLKYFGAIGITASSAIGLYYLLQNIIEYRAGVAESDTLVGSVILPVATVFLSMVAMVFLLSWV